MTALTVRGTVTDRTGAATQWSAATDITTAANTKPVIGVTGGNEAGFNAINAQVGPVLACRTYNTTLPASWATSAAASDVAAGRHSYWSWKPAVATFPTSTSQKDAFSAFLDTIPAGHKATIVAWHEPEDDIEGGAWTLAQWTALQNAVSAIVKGKGRPNLRVGVCLMGPWTFDTRSGRTAWDWSGLNWANIDVVGIDPYRLTTGSTMSLQTLLTVNNSGSGTGGTQPSTMAHLAQWGKPVSLMEWGVANSTEASVATFITQGYAWMKAWNQANPATLIESALWYNYTLTNTDTPLTGVEVTAYAAAVADSKVAA